MILPVPICHQKMESPAVAFSRFSLGYTPALQVLVDIFPFGVSQSNQQSELCIVLKKVYSKLSKPMSELNFPPVRRRYYAVKTKLSAVRDRVINEIGYAEVLAKYEVKPSTFHVWLHKYKSRVLSEEQHKRLSSRNYKMLYPMTDQERAELESLRQEVEKQKILVEAYELMLELARERLHVDVKKNYEEILLAGLSRDKKSGEVKP